MFILEWIFAPIIAMVALMDSGLNWEEFKKQYKIVRGKR